MTKQEFITLLEDVLEAEPGSMIGNEALKDLEGWGSLATVSLIAMVDENFGVTLSPKDIAESKSVSELIALLGDRITA